jgi:hypothetical protein
MLHESFDEVVFGAHSAYVAVDELPERSRDLFPLSDGVGGMGAEQFHFRPLLFPVRLAALEPELDPPAVAEETVELRHVKVVASHHPSHRLHGFPGDEFRSQPAILEE